MMRSGVGAACALTLDLLLDLEDARFLFLAVVEWGEDEVCAAPGRAALDTTGAALKRSAAPNMDNTVRLVIV
jgi:hypothetical protein